jgi:hypothetical protein
MAFGHERTQLVLIEVKATTASDPARVISSKKQNQQFLKQ